MGIQRTTEVIKITTMSMDHLAMTTSTGASRRRAAVIASPSLEPDKPCCSRQSGGRRANAPKDQRTRVATIDNEESRRSERSNLKQINKDEQRPDPNRSTEHQHQLNPARSDGEKAPHALRRC